MEFIRTIKEKAHTKREENMQKQAEYVITLEDYANDLYISFQGVPMIKIQEDWTSQQIVQHLSKLRQQYIDVKLKQLNRQVSPA